jgi:hypothetical protein
MIPMRESHWSDGSHAIYQAISVRACWLKVSGVGSSPDTIHQRQAQPFFIDRLAVNHFDPILIAFAEKLE